MSTSRHFQYSARENVNTRSFAGARDYPLSVTASGPSVSVLDLILPPVRRGQLVAQRRLLDPKRILHALPECVGMLLEDAVWQYRPDA
jgi:hypothetical protein